MFGIGLGRGGGSRGRGRGGGGCDRRWRRLRSSVHAVVVIVVITCDVNRRFGISFLWHGRDDPAEYAGGQIWQLLLVLWRTWRRVIGKFEVVRGGGVCGGGSGGRDGVCGGGGDAAEELRRKRSEEAAVDVFGFDPGFFVLTRGSRGDGRKTRERGKVNRVDHFVAQLAHHFHRLRFPRIQIQRSNFRKMHAQ